MLSIRSSPSALPSWLASGLVFSYLVPTISAHEHHTEEIPEGMTVSMDPIDTTLWIHIFVQMFAWGILFPLGMVFGIVKSRWHVPTQVLGTALAILGYFLGHAHKGRQFVEGNVHSKAVAPLMLMLICQVVLGIYLRLHLENGIHGKIRRIVRPIHSVMGKVFPVAAWVQMIFGGITTLGFCQGDHLGQCLAHFIMGGAFVAYGIILTIILLAGQLFMRRTGRSQEFFDSVVIAAWGCVNTFTEHHWGTAWVKNDWQHTTMGVIWWCAGLAGIWLSRDSDGNPKRNFIPGFVIFITGWGMSAHPQSLMESAMVHTTFGYTLMGVGVTRIIEISFVLRDKQSLSDDGRQTHSWQYVPVYLLYASGFLFMGATEEQMQLLAGSSMDAISYILILFSLAFLVFLFTNILIHLYDRATKTAAKPPANDQSIEERQLRAAEEFELDGLMSDEEDDSARLLKGTGADSPSTVGRNNEPIAR